MLTPTCPLPSLHHYALFVARALGARDPEVVADDAATRVFVHVRGKGVADDPYELVRIAVACLIVRGEGGGGDDAPVVS